MYESIISIYKSVLRRLKNKEILKRLIIVTAIILIALTVFSKPLSFKSIYDLKADTTSVILVDHNFKTSYELAKDVFEMDIRLKRQCDILCEIDGVVYYLINSKIKL